MIEDEPINLKKISLGLVLISSRSWAVETQIETLLTYITDYWQKYFQQLLYAWNTVLSFTVVYTFQYEFFAR